MVRACLRPWRWGWTDGKSRERNASLCFSHLKPGAPALPEGARSLLLNGVGWGSPASAQKQDNAVGYLEHERWGRGRRGSWPPSWVLGLGLLRPTEAPPQASIPGCFPSLMCQSTPGQMPAARAGPQPGPRAGLLWDHPAISRAQAAGHLAAGSLFEPRAPPQERSKACLPNPALEPWPSHFLRLPPYSNSFSWGPSYSPAGERKARLAVQEGPLGRFQLSRCTCWWEPPRADARAHTPYTGTLQQTRHFELTYLGSPLHQFKQVGLQSAHICG